MHNDCGLDQIEQKDAEIERLKLNLAKINSSISNWREAGFFQPEPEAESDDDDATRNWVSTFVASFPLIFCGFLTKHCCK